MEYETLTASELGQGINEGKYDPEEVIEYFIARIIKLNPTINAFTYTKFDYARAEAKKLKERLSRGEAVGPFAGVPFGIKDFLPSKQGWSASHGGVPSRITIDPIDSEFTKAMEKAGGIALGKTNAPAYGYSGLTDNLMYGPTHNPFDPSRNSGGSSGGSAAAISSGMLLLSEGGDAGGSIRIPSAWNNLFGLKPSAGLVPSVIRPDSYSATHPYCCGFGLTKSVQDAAILLNYMAKYDPRDPTSVPASHDDYLVEMAKSLQGKRVAYTPSFGLCPVEKEIDETVRKTLSLLKQEGVQIEEVDIRFNRSINEFMDMWCLCLAFDSTIEFEELKAQGNDFLSEHGDELSPKFVDYVKRAAFIGKDELYQFNLMRTEILDAFEDVFEQYDVIVSPTAFCLPPHNGKTRGSTRGPNNIGGTPIDPDLGFSACFLANFVGYPAASVPSGLSKDGLPIGMQFLAPKYQEGRILAFARAIEKLAPWRERYPNL